MLATAACMKEDVMQNKQDSHQPASGGGKPFGGLAYDIGTPFSGQTHLSLHGDGSYSLWSTVTEGRARLEFTGTLDGAELQGLLTALSHSRFWEEPGPEKARTPDDVKARITLKTGDAEQAAAVWLSQMDEHPAFRTAQTALLTLIAKLSGNKILEKGQ
jgi:hypothetical protein